MPTTDDDAFDEIDQPDDDAPTRRRIARLLLRSALCQARQLRAGLSRPRKRRLVKEARAVKSLMADARAAGLVPPARKRARADDAAMRRRAR
jgi:hypothetical protein